MRAGSKGRGGDVQAGRREGGGWVVRAGVAKEEGER